MPANIRKVRTPSNTAIHRSLARANAEDYRGFLSGKCLARARPEALTLVLYDVTTLYFEVAREDDYRKPGFSKERRRRGRSRQRGVSSTNGARSVPSSTSTTSIRHWKRPRG